MKLKGNQKGFTLIEVVASMAVGGMLLSILVSSTSQTINVTSDSEPQITALEDIKNAARWIIGDVHMAYGTNLVDEYPTVYNQLILDWTSWFDIDPVDHHCEYTLSGTEVVRNYDGNITTFGRYISDIEFSREGNIITVTITSSPEGKVETAEQKTYRMYLQPKEEAVQP